MAAGNSTNHPPELEDLPPSAKLVYKVLEQEGALTQQEIAEESLLASRTARYAVNNLEEIGAITSEILLRDARQKRYSLAE